MYCDGDTLWVFHRSVSWAFCLWHSGFGTVTPFLSDLKGSMTYNPSLREEPRFQRVGVIPQRHDTSILDWLEQSGRLLARDSSDFDYADDEEEINELMATDDGSFDLDDDDDDLDLED